MTDDQAPDGGSDRAAYMREYMRAYRSGGAVGDDPTTNPSFTGDDIRWQDQAACAGLDSELWFPERGESTAVAKEICRGCPVRQECLDYALEHAEKFGIWGGLSERERRRERRRRNRARRGEAA